MAIYLAALLIGVIAGLRTMTPLAAISWAAHLRAIHVAGTWVAFVGNPYAVGLLTLTALAELVVDKLPNTPSRTIPVAFGARIASGALSGAALVVAAGPWPAGLALGGVGAVLGTLGGARVRSRLAAAFDRDRPAAFIEDAVAIGGAALTLALLG